MIVDGVITYPNVNGDFKLWRFSNDVLNQLAFGTLLTILSYQVSETLLNFCFGIKQRGKTKLSDLHIMLLIRKWSPIHVLKSIFFSTKSTKEEVDFDDDYKYQVDEYSSEMETDRHSNLRVYSKLILLLLAVPLINIMTVFLCLQSDTILIFADANFGGLALGLDPERPISQLTPLTFSNTNACQVIELRSNAGEFPIADFNICTQEVRRGTSANSNDSIIRVITEVVTGSESASAFVVVTVGSQVVEYSKRAMLTTAKSSMSGDRNLYTLTVNLLEEDGEFLTTRGLELAKRHCDSTDQFKRQRATRGGIISLSQSLECRQESERSEAEDLQSAKTVALELLQFVSVVNSDELLVRNVDEVDASTVKVSFLPASDLLLLRYDRGYVSIPILVITILVTLLLRALSELLTNNDVEKGIGLNLRDGLGLPCCDSMLSSRDVVAQYDSRGNILYAIERKECSSMDEKKIYSSLDFNTDDKRQTDG